MIIPSSMNLSLFIIILTSFISADPVAETYLYDIIRHRKVIGELKAEKTIKNDLITYESFTRINARVIKKIEVVYEFEVKMKGDILLEADAKIEVNGKVHNHTTTKLNRDRYKVDGKKRKIRKTFTDAISYPGILFVFEEPVDRSRSYSEEEGDFHFLESMGNHSYRKVNQKGRSNFYHYRNGKLRRAEIDAGFVRFEIVARK